MTRLLVLILSAVIAVSAADLLTHLKHFKPSVPEEPIFAHFDNQVPVVTGERATINDVDSINERYLAQDLDAVVKADFFSIFKADVNSPCSHGAVYAQCALEGGCDITDCGSPADWHEFDRSPFKPAPLEISQAIGLLESYFSVKRMSGAAPALQQLRALVEAGDGNAVDRSLSKYEHMKWLEDPAHDLWLVPDGSSAQYFDLRRNDERFTGYGVLALQKEATAVWQRIFDSARNVSSIESHSTFAHKVLERLVSGLRAKIATHVANNYYSHEILCKEAWNNAKRSLSRQECSSTKGSATIPTESVAKHLLPQLSEKFPHTVGNSSRALQFLASFFASNGEGVSQTECCRAIRCLYAANGNADQQKSGYEPSLAVFSSRLAANPDHVRNIYFTWLFLLRALKKAAPKISAYDFSFSSSGEEAARTRALVMQLLQHVQKNEAGQEAFKMLRAEKKLFQSDEERKKLVEIMRANFHSISENVDCIACESCRLQAKVKITGLAFAVRIILDDDLLSKTTYGRNDVIAFINTIQQFSKALRIVHRLSDMTSGRPDPWMHADASQASADACPRDVSV